MSIGITPFEQIIFSEIFVSAFGIGGNLFYGDVFIRICMFLQVFDDICAIGRPCEGFTDGNGSVGSADNIVGDETFIYLIRFVQKSCVRTSGAAGCFVLQFFEQLFPVTGGCFFPIPFFIRRIELFSAERDVLF